MMKRGAFHWHSLISVRRIGQVFIFAFNLNMSAPAITEEIAAGIVESLYGIKGTFSMLGSCQDVNYKLKATSGDLYVVKIANSATSKNDIEFQNKLMLHLSSNADLANEYSFPTPIRQLDGVSYYSTISLSGNDHIIRLLSFVKGNILSDTVYFSPEVLYSLGQCVAKICKSLKDMNSDGLTVPEFIQWDLQQAPQVIQELLPKIHEERDRVKLSNVCSVAFRALEPLRPFLRKQIVHGDLAHYNLVSKRGIDGSPVVSGVIDFGDAMRSWVVGDLAVCITSGFEYDGWKRNVLLQTGQVLRGFLSTTELNAQEIESIWPLILIRSVVNIVSINQELLLEPDNPYNIDGLAKEWKIFQRINNFDIDVGINFLKTIAQTPIPRSVPSVFDGSNISDLIQADTSNYNEIDLSYACGDYHAGNWMDRFHVKSLIEAKGPFSFAEFGIPRFYLGRTRSLTEPSTVPLGVDIFLPTATVITAPCEGNAYVLELDSNSLVIMGLGFDIVIRGIVVETSLAGGRSETTGKLVVKGQNIGVVKKSDDDYLPDHINIQISKKRISSINGGLPRYCQASMFPAWSSILLSPMELFGFNSGSRYTEFHGTADLAIQKRGKFVASVQQHYFISPPCIERGFGAFMYDINGRSYLDVVNNVALVGHCNPRIIDATMKQAQLLNTNSRFIYQQLGNVAEKIISKMPKESKLEVVFFVNSGSEATDLAQRLARTVVAQRRRSQHESEISLDDELSKLRSKLYNRNIICLEGAYHGITTASDEISTTLNDNPRSRESRPPWIHLVRMPNPYRGLHEYPSLTSGSLDEVDSKSAQAASAYADFVDSKVDELVAAGDAPVGFIAEPLSGNAGGVELPRGYLKRVYQKIRSVGGLCISDEVQVGYGRLGTNFWGFQEHGVIPDIVTMAKAAGNGHPFGFVVTSREIADEFGVDGSFFSSAGGGPVSCAVGNAVLQEIDNLQLQRNALEVGHHLKKELVELVSLFPETVGAIHGHGLYMGIEIIKDSISRQPGTEEAYAICRRLLELGVICHNTGDYSNVLKVKPPLVISVEDADFFVAALKEAFIGW